MRFKFETSLDFQECQKRLKDNIAKSKQQGTENTPLIMGNIRRKSFTLWIRRYVNIAGDNQIVRNSFASVCFGKLIPNRGTTIVKGYIGMHPIIIAFLSIWFTGIIGFGGLGIASVAVNVASGRSNTDDLIGTSALVVGMLAFGIIILFVGNRLSREDSADFIHFIKSILNVYDTY
jgi:hypothetical protein